MQPNLAQVLNTLAHEIRTPLAVSQGYLKLYLDGRLTNVDDTRKAFEQTRQALGTLATLCVDMGKVSALSESAVTTRRPRARDRRGLRHEPARGRRNRRRGLAGCGDRRRCGAIETANHRDLAQAVAIVAKAAFDEARDAAARRADARPATN